MLGAASPGKDIFKISCKLDSAIATDVISIDVSDDKFLPKNLFLQVKLFNSGWGTSPNSLPLDSTRSAQKNGEATVEVETLDTETTDTKLKTVEVEKGASDKADLTEASVIISGGRAMGAAEKFSILEEC